MSGFHELITHFIISPICEGTPSTEMKYILFPETTTFITRDLPEIFLTVSCSPLYPFITTLFLTRPDSVCPASLYPIYKLLIIYILDIKKQDILNPVL